MERERTITRTFRVNERALKALEDEARHQNVSVNTLVNQTFLSYANFDRFVKKLHLIKISRPTFRTVLDAADEDAIIEAGHQAGSDVPKYLIIAKDGTLSLETVLAHLKGLADYGNLYEYTESVKARRRVVTLGHELGPKGTLFLAHYVQTVFRSVDANPTFALGDNSIVMEF